MDIILRKLVQATPAVPNSLEPGSAYQATHAPAPAYAHTLTDARVLVHATTDPTRGHPRSEDGSSPRLEVETLAIPRRRVGPVGVWAGVLGGLVVAIGVAGVVAMETRRAPAERRALAASSTPPAVGPLSSPTPASAPVVPVQLDPPQLPLATVGASATASSPRSERLPPPQLPTAAPRPKPTPTVTSAPPSSLINQAPL